MRVVHTPQMVRNTVMQLEMNLFTPISDIRVINTLHKDGPGVSMVSGGAFRLGVCFWVERPGY